MSSRKRLSLLNTFDCSKGIPLSPCLGSHLRRIRIGPSGLDSMCFGATRNSVLNGFNRPPSSQAERLAYFTIFESSGLNGSRRCTTLFASPDCVQRSHHASTITIIVLFISPASTWEHPLCTQSAPPIQVALHPAVIQHTSPTFYWHPFTLIRTKSNLDGRTFLLRSGTRRAEKEGYSGRSQQGTFHLHSTRFHNEH